MHRDVDDHEYRMDTRLHPDGDDLKEELEEEVGESIPLVTSEGPADEPRGEDEVRRELGPGDGDDPPPDEDDEPLAR